MSTSIPKCPSYGDRTVKRLTGIVISLFGAWLGVGLPAACAQSPFEELASKIPPSANAIVLIDAQRLFGSPLSVREGWKNGYEQAFVGGSVTMAPDTQRMILAAQIEYESMEPKWEIAVADLGKPRTAVEVARATKGVLDPFGDTPAVALRGDAYAVELAPTRYAAMSPANRQSVARWLREAQSRTAPALPPYLKGTLVASQQSEVVMALDLEDAIPPDVVRAKLAASAAVKGKKIDLDAASNALDGIRGLVLEVDITDGSFARLMIHFRGDATVLAPVAKPLLQEVLADLGATIDDIDDWKLQSETQRIVLHGALSAAGRKRVFSLIDNPLSSLLAEDQSSNPVADRQQSQTIAASQHYFKAITSIVREVREKSSDAKTFGQNAMWFDKWARRIDALPVLHVDQELLAFSEYLSTQLRNMAAAMRGIGINSGGRSASYPDWRYADDDRRAIRAQEKAKGATTARGIVHEIESALAKIRKDLTQKYQVEF